MANQTQKWNCSACTFINEVSKSRCEMCSAHRPRNLKQVKSKSHSPKQTGPVIDLTAETPPDKNGSGYNGGGESLYFNLASTESARKKRRRSRSDSQGTETEKEINFDVSVPSRQKSISSHAFQSASAPGMFKRSSSQTTSVNRSSRNKRDVQDHERNDEESSHLGKSRSINDRGQTESTKSNKKNHQAHQQNQTSQSASTRKDNQKVKHASSVKSSGMVQKTLFGSIIRDIQETDVTKLSNKPVRKNNTNASKKRQREDEYKPIQAPSTDMNQPTPKPTIEITKPPLNLQTNQTTFKPSYQTLRSNAMSILQSKFKIPSLRSLQPTAIRSALNSQSQIIIMATGGGKSLCYQLPAAVLPGVTIVVSPLIALMVDQVNALNKKGIEAALISSANGERDNKMVLQRLVGKKGDDGKKAKNKGKSKQGKDEKCQNGKVQVDKQIKLLYCTPELIQTTRFRAVLSDLYGRGLLSLIAIDEAHCLSTWGHDFRPAYRKLSWLRSSFPDVPCMACTATATAKVIQDIKQVLNFNKGEKCHKSTFNRANVSYEVRYKDSMGDDDALKDLVKTVKQYHQKADKEGLPCSGIVYVHKRDDTTMITAKLQKAGVAAAPYHAGLKDADRKRMQEEWTSGKIKVAIATVAFGMGIDLAHVRYVMHWSMSKTVEGFYQESGRAGRDGLPSKSILYFSKSDASKFAFLIQKNAERKEAKGQKPIADDRSLDALNKMVDYCTKPSCRRKYLLKHFGEDIDPKKVCKMTCDFCLDPKKVEMALNSSSTSKATRDVRRQKFRYQKEPALDGGYNHGIFDDEEDFDDFYTSKSDSGLGITHNPSASVGFATAGGTKLNGSKAARNILSRYEALECRTAFGKSNGFVKFKAKTKAAIFETGDGQKDGLERKDTSVVIPTHLLQKVQAKMSTSTADTASKPQQSSKDLSSEADKVRAELEEIRKKKAMLLAKFSKK